MLECLAQAVGYGTKSQGGAGQGYEDEDEEDTTKRKMDSAIPKRSGGHKENL